MNRIAPLDREQGVVAAGAAGVPSARLSTNVFRVLLKHEDYAHALHLAISSLLNGRLDFRLQELAILRVAWLTNCAYEWAYHYRRATDATWASPSDPTEPGRAARVRHPLPQADLVGVRDWRNHSGFGSADRAVLAATDELVCDATISSQTWRSCVDALAGDERLLIELVATISLWHSLALVMNALAVDLDPGFEPWRPDGVGPR